MAKYFFGNESPLGRHIGWGRDKTPDIEIVGVARDSKTATLRQEKKRFVYTPYTQEPEIGQMTFYVARPRRRGGDRRLGPAGRRSASIRTCRSST